MKKQKLYRILDANFNRSREGLRVCEEIVRFVLNDRALAAGFKKTRHAVTDCLRRLAVYPLELLAARNARTDVGRGPSKLEKKEGWEALFFANSQRAKESLRVLEETSKLVDDKISAKLKKIRFEVYDLEKKILPKLETLRDHR